MFWLHAEFTRRLQLFRICNNRFTKFVQFLSHETTLRIRWFVKGVWWWCVLYLIGEIGWIGAFKLLLNDGSWFWLSQSSILVEFEITRWKLKDSRMIVGGCVVCFQSLAVCWLPVGGKVWHQAAFTFVWRHRGGSVPSQWDWETSVSVPCECVWGRGGARSHTQADWLRPHLAVESTGAGSHVGP